MYVALPYINTYELSYLNTYTYLLSLRRRRARINAAMDMIKDTDDSTVEVIQKTLELVFVSYASYSAKQTGANVV